MKNFIITLLVLGAITLLMQIDDEPSETTQQLLKKSEPARHSQAYLYLMGINAPLNQDPILAGKDTFNAIQNDQNSVDNALPLPKGPLFCRLSEPACLTQLFTTPTTDINNVLTTHQPLLKRYRHFITLNDYATLSEPLLNEIIPPYEYIAKGNRLALLHSLSKQTTTPEKTIQELEYNLQRLRAQLANADNLIWKMILAILISENIDVLYLANQTNEQNIKLNLKPLTQQEKDLTTAIAREFRMNYNLFQNMDKHPEFWEMGDNAPGWAVRAVFKPNMSSNSMADFYSHAISNNQLNPAAFAARLKKGQPPEIEKNWVRNPAGSILSQITPNLNIYSARLLDLDCKIHLFNNPSTTTSNPYYPGQKTAYLSDDNKQLLLDGPLPDTRLIRQIRIEL